MQYITRDDLYARVWREPMVRLAPSLGAAAPALKQLCRQAAIPLPGAGHWSRLRSGKPGTSYTLPPRPPGTLALIVIGRPSSWWRGPREMLVDPVPPEPDFPEPLDALALRLASQLKPLRQPTPIRPPPGTSAPVRRRLQLLADLRALLGQVIAQPDLVEEAPETYRAEIHAFSVRFTLGASASAPQALSLRLEGSAGCDAGKASVFGGTDGEPLEAQLHAVAVELLVRAEATYRHRARRFYEARLESRREAEADARSRRRKAAALLDQRRLDRQQARRDLLFAQADAWRTAQNIRGFVAEALAATPVGDRTIELQTWAEWARREADDLDPVKRRGLAAPLQT